MYVRSIQNVKEIYLLTTLKCIHAVICKSFVKMSELYTDVEKSQRCFVI